MLYDIIIEVSDAERAGALRRCFIEGAGFPTHSGHKARESKSANARHSLNILAKFNQNLTQVV